MALLSNECLFLAKDVQHEHHHVLIHVFILDFEVAAKTNENRNRRPKQYHVPMYPQNEDEPVNIDIGNWFDISTPIQAVHYSAPALLSYKYK